ncbi:MAG: GNAT family N-acetyltransferase [Phycisphaerales bacterium]|nr:GNAT family N-acetyltransferase [Phycisphaerales bacterium]
MPATLPIRMLVETDVDAFCDHLATQDDVWIRNREMPYGPYSASTPPDRAARRAKTLERWAKPLDVTGWRRSWGLLDGAACVGVVTLIGGDLDASLHRVMLGLGVEPPHRRQGHGRRLMHVAIDWARAEPTIDWIDLGVFRGNDGAFALYRDLGFREIGRTTDCFRVDGWRIETISMTLHVGAAADRPGK